MLFSTLVVETGLKANAKTRLIGFQPVQYMKMEINEVTRLEIGILISISKSSKRVTSWNSHLNFSRYYFTLAVTITYA